MQKQQVQDIDHKIAQRIYDRRYDLGLTTTDVARKMGMSQAAYSRMESGKVVISVSRILKIAEILRTDIPSLVNGHQTLSSLGTTDTGEILCRGGLPDEGAAEPILPQAKRNDAETVQSESNPQPDLADQITRIITAFLAKNAVTAEQLPSLIGSVREALSPSSCGKDLGHREGEIEQISTATKISQSSIPSREAASSATALAPDQRIITDELTNIHARRISQAEKLTPATDPRDSIHHKFIYCLECGAPFQSLKKHLGAQHEITPEDYREKWGLPIDYPMSAPAYSSKRSLIAKNIHHGRLKKRVRR